MILEWKVAQRKWDWVNEQPITLCGEFKDVSTLERMYRTGGIEHEHGWYILSGSITVLKL